MAVACQFGGSSNSGRRGRATGRGSRLIPEIEEANSSSLSAIAATTAVVAGCSMLQQPLDHPIIRPPALQLLPPSFSLL